MTHACYGSFSESDFVFEVLQPVKVLESNPRPEGESESEKNTTRVSEVPMGVSEALFVYQLVDQLRRNF